MKKNNKKSKSLDEKYTEVWVPSSWLKGSKDYIYMDEITVHYSLN